MPLKGVVTVNGTPLPNAQVRLIPVIGYGADYIATATTDDNGRFTLQCHGQPGACATENTIVVTEADIPAQYHGESRQTELAGYLRSLKNRPIPPAYASPVSTPLKVTVSEGQPDLNLELKR